MKRVIVLSGPRGAGKTTIGNLIAQHKHQSEQIAFADRVVNETAAMTGKPRGLFTTHKVKDEPLSDFFDLAPPRFLAWLRQCGFNFKEPTTPRKALEIWSDYAKSVEGQHYYTQLVIKQIEASSNRIIVVTDARQHSEFTALLSLKAANKDISVSRWEVSRPGCVYTNERWDTFIPHQMPMIELQNNGNHHHLLNTILFLL